MIIFGAVKGAIDIINETAADAEKRADEAAKRSATVFVDDTPGDNPSEASDDDYVV